MVACCVWLLFASSASTPTPDRECEWPSYAVSPAASCQRVSASALCKLLPDRGCF